MADHELKAHLLMLKGAISDMPESDQAKVKQLTKDIVAIVKEGGDLGVIAVTIAGLYVAGAAE